MNMNAVPRFTDVATQGALAHLHFGSFLDLLILYEQRVRFVSDLVKIWRISAIPDGKGVKTDGF